MKHYHTDGKFMVAKLKKNNNNRQTLTLKTFDWEPCHLVVSSFGALSYWQRFLVAKLKKKKKKSKLNYTLMTPV